MKVFYSLDVSDSGNVSVPNGQEFMVASTSSDLLDEYQEATEAVDKIYEKAKLPTGLHILRFVLVMEIIVIFLMLAGIISSHTNSVFQIVGFVLLLGGIFTGLYFIGRFEKNRRTRINNSDELKQAYERINQLSEKIIRSYNASESTYGTDILAFSYQTKTNRKGKTKITVIDRYNLSLAAYTEDENLCLIALDARFEIPVSSLERITTVNERYPLNRWNKQISPDDEEIKKLGLHTDAYGIRYADRFHILEFSHNGERWGLYFPCYELPVFEKLTGLKAEKN